MAICAKKNKNKLRELEKQNHSLVMNDSHLKDDLNAGKIDESSTLGENISNAVEGIISSAPCSRCGDRRIKHEVSEAITHPTFMNG